LLDLADLSINFVNLVIYFINFGFVGYLLQEK
jgi:hypothetical protein